MNNKCEYCNVKGGHEDWCPTLLWADEPELPKPRDMSGATTGEIISAMYDEGLLSPSKRRPGTGVDLPIPSQLVHGSASTRVHTAAVVDDPASQLLRQLASTRASCSTAANSHTGLENKDCGLPRSPPNPAVNHVELDCERQVSEATPLTLTLPPHVARGPLSSPKSTQRQVGSERDPSTNGTAFTALQHRRSGVAARISPKARTPSLREPASAILRPSDAPSRGRGKYCARAGSMFSSESLLADVDTFCDINSLEKLEEANSTVPASPSTRKTGKRR
ncbi:hypothetical protein CYMTET_4486 [Cymbomonas tetramitiformis]|uniref:Uncharacterized protein n=1 Tax=Cymbomonas tetramitiformis TaxID=36881 RepID=A0AAE0LJU5_9CHLO|nr:hypothetical protein CYMTET_4486 [Cymbomonas tetramitiformis]